MPTRPGHRSAVRFAIAAVLAVAAFASMALAPVAPSAAALSRWTGSIDLYRSGVFTTQQSWLWCTAADVQIMRNIVHRQTDHATSSQRRYFDYMRAHNRYRIPVSDGVDPAGWTAGLRRYVDARYRLVSSGSFDAALRSAVTNLRKTNLPVGITVSHGGHAWVLTGFTATADPATATRFTVTSVRVTGPLWGLQSRSYGYDMRPNTKLTVSQLKGFFTPWHYAGVRMAWEGRWVSIQPIPAAATAAPAPAPTPTSSPRVSASPSAPPSAPVVSSVDPSAGAGAVAVVGPTPVASVLAEPVGTSAPAVPTSVPVWLAVVGWLVIAGVVAGSVLALARVTMPRRTTR
jgi:hypothetical protein